jgi:hypothetical protein
VRSPFVLAAETASPLPERLRDLDRVLRIAFIHTQLKSCSELVQLARTEQARDDQGSFDAALASADATWREARQWIRKAEELGIDVTAERRENDLLGQMLLDVQEEQP